MGSDNLKQVDGVLTTEISSRKFIEISDGIYTYFGGRQNWFMPNNIGVAGGCGTTAVANLLAYLAKSDRKFRNLYRYNIENLNVEDFTKHMNEVYEYVTPIKVAKPIVGLGIGKYGIPVTLGVPTLVKLVKGVNKFAEARGIDLQIHQMLRVSKTESAIDHIRDGLEMDSPVLLLIYLNPDLKEVGYTDYKGIEKKGDFQRHWVTITAIHENGSTGRATIDVSSWGSKATLDLAKVMSFSGFGGMMYSKHQ